MQFWNSLKYDLNKKKAKQNGENCSNVKIVLFRMLNKIFFFFRRSKRILALELFCFLNTKWMKPCNVQQTPFSERVAGIQFCPTEYSNSHAMQCPSYSFPELIFSYMKLSLFKRRLIFAHFRVSYKPGPILSWNVEEPSSSLCCNSWVKKVLISAFQHSR